MRIFLDTAKADEVKKWLPVIEGVTTNPAILEKDKGDVVEIAKLIDPKIISIEAGGNFIDDARYWHGALTNVAIKIPLLKPDGGNNIDLIYELALEGVLINCTALFSLSQIILAEKAGAAFVSLFAGRVDDEGGDFAAMIRDCSHYLYHSDTELIVGSIRTVGNALEAIRSGADIVTIPPPILEKMVNHQYSLKTVKEFEDSYARISK